MLNLRSLQSNHKNSDKAAIMEIESVNLTSVTGRKNSEFNIVERRYKHPKNQM